MKTPTSDSPHRGGAFTLIELLVVIAVISVLAGLLLAVMPAIRVKAAMAKARAELVQVQAAIEAYKAKLGYYPPDNATNAAINQLYYELSGTFSIYTNGTKVYVTLDGSGQIGTNAATGSMRWFAREGFANSSTSRLSTDDRAAAINFLKEGLKPEQLSDANVVPRRLLYSGGLGYGPYKDSNPWRYNSSNPTNNPGRYDLWVDITVGGKTNRVSNWSKQPQIVP